MPLPPEWIAVEKQILQGLLMDASLENRETEMAIEQGIAESEEAMMQMKEQQQLEQ